MAYKFQVGAARLSGSTVFEEPVTVASLDAGSGGISNAGAVSGVSTLSGSGKFEALELEIGHANNLFNVSKAGSITGQAADFQSLALNSGGITAAGALAGVSTIAASGLSSLDGGINVNSSQFTVSNAGVVVAEGTVSGAAGSFDAITGTSIALQSGGITAAGAIAGATTIAGSGLASLGSLAVDDSSTIGCDSDPDLLTLSSGLVVVAGELQATTLDIGGTNISATATEINYLDNDDLEAADFVKLAALTATAAEINYLDNDDLVAADLQKLADLTVTAAELNVLDQLAQGSILLGDGSGAAAITDIKTDGQILVGNGTTATSVAVSGDAALANNGAVTLTSAQTNIQSVLNTALVVGRDADNDIDFATDNQIMFRAAGADQFALVDGGIVPVTDSDVDLGSSSKRFKDAFLDSATVTGVVAAAGAVSGSALSGSGELKVGGSVQFDGVPEDSHTLSKDADMIFYRDGSDFLMKSITFESFMTGAAGDGIEVNAQKFRLDLKSSGGLKFVSGEVSVEPDDIAGHGLEDDTSDKLQVKLDSNSGLARAASGIKVDLSGLATTAVAVADDAFAFIDSDDGGASKQVSISSLVGSIAGSGLSHSSGVLSVSSNNVSSVVSGSVLSEGVNFISAAATGSHGLTLPAAPTVGDVVTLKAGSGVNQTRFVEIKRAGSQTIDGEVSVKIESPFGAVTCVYVDDTSKDWRII